MIELAELTLRLRELVSRAELGGAAPAWLDETSDMLAAMLRDHEALLLNAAHPRRAAMIADVKRITKLLKSAERAGDSPADARQKVRERLGLSPDQFDRRMSLSRRSISRGSLELRSRAEVKDD